MKLSKFFLFVVIFTLLTLGYVHQQIELFKVSYSIEENYSALTKLLDDNGYLLYNIAALKSPHNLEQMLLAKNTTFELPAITQFMRIEQPQLENRLNRWERTKIAFANIFALSSNAEAKALDKNR